MNTNELHPRGFLASCFALFEQESRRSGNETTSVLETGWPGYTGLRPRGLFIDYTDPIDSKSAHSVISRLPPDFPG
jgi:hypothetical protein